MNIRIWECKCTQIHIFKKVYAGVKPAFLGKVKDSRLKEIIEKCILPASVRPSAEELSNVSVSNTSKVVYFMHLL